MIEVKDDTVKTVLATAFRQVMIMLTTAWLTAKGFSADDVSSLSEGITAAAILAVTVGYGLFKAYRTKAKLKALAIDAPNGVLVK